MTMITEKVHISLIRGGDVVICSDGLARTVNKKDLKRGFMGITLWGNSYRMGTTLVERIIARR